MFRFVFQEHGGIYVAYIGAFLIALFLFARTLYYCTLSVSTIDGPMWAHQQIHVIIKKR